MNLNEQFNGIYLNMVWGHIWYSRRNSFELHQLKNAEYGVLSDAIKKKMILYTFVIQMSVILSVPYRDRYMFIVDAVRKLEMYLLKFNFD